MRRNQILLRSQRNQVFRILRAEGLEPAEFEWAKETIANVLVVSRLNHRDGDFYFQFSSHEVNAWCIACPGRFRQSEYEYPRSWNDQVAAFRTWIGSLKREIGSPDAWLELAKYRLVLGVEIPEDAVNEPISAIESEEIAAALARLADRIIEQWRPDETQASTIRGRCDYLADAARRQRSRDWMYALLGVCTAIAAALALPRENADRLWMLFEEGLGPFARLLPARETMHCSVR
jgi:hypothetical protein